MLKDEGYTSMFDVHESVHRDVIMKAINKMQLCSFNSSMTPASSDLGEYYQIL